MSVHTKRLNAGASTLYFESRINRGQPRTRQADSSFRSLRPDESASLKTLGKQAQAVSIEPEKLDHVASAPAKDEDVTGERLLLQHSGPETHVSYPSHRGDPDPPSRAKLDHLRRLSRIERNGAASAPHSTLIIARPGNSM